MRLLFHLTALCFWIAGAASFALPAQAEEENAPPRVVASILPVYFLAAGVMEGAGAPSLLLPRDASPHHYALRPSDARRIGRAEIIFWIGPAMETFLQRPLTRLAPKALRLALMEEEAAEGEAHDHDHHHQDAHIWLDVSRAIAMTTMMRDALAKQDPRHANLYRGNARRQIERLRALDRKIAERMRPLGKKPYLAFHDAYGHFARRYGLSPGDFVTRTPERKPSAARLRRIRQKIQKEGIACLFSEPGASRSLIKAVLEGTAARSVALDPLGATLKGGGGENYDALMRNLSEKMADCLEKTNQNP